METENYPRPQFEKEEWEKIIELFNQSKQTLEQKFEQKNLSDIELVSLRKKCIEYIRQKEKELKNPNERKYSSANPYFNVVIQWLYEDYGIDLGALPYKFFSYSMPYTEVIVHDLSTGENFKYRYDIIENESPAYTEDAENKEKQIKKLRHKVQVEEKIDQRLIDYISSVREKAHPI